MMLLDLILANLLMMMWDTVLKLHGDAVGDTVGLFLMMFEKQ